MNELKQYYKNIKVATFCPELYITTPPWVKKDQEKLMRRRAINHPVVFFSGTNRLYLQ